MAQELTIVVSVAFNGKNELKAFKTPTLSAILDMAGDDMTSGTQLISSSGEEALDVGADLTTFGYMLIYNPDADNFV
jgi:hypothetical protein